MKILKVTPNHDCTLDVVAEDGRCGKFDVRPYFASEAFKKLSEWSEFSRVRNGGYFIEWPSGADLSADTIEARWKLYQSTSLARPD